MVPIKYHPSRIFAIESWWLMVWERYEAAKLAQGILPKTLHDYRVSCNQFAEYLNRRSAHPSKGMLEEFLADLSRRGASAFRRRNTWVALRSVYSWYEAEGLGRSPMRGISPPKLPKYRIEIYEDDELEAGIARIRTRKSPNNHRDETIILLFLDTGLRRHELVSARIMDVDIDRQHIKVRGKGAKDRTVPFGDHCREMIGRHLEGDRRCPDNRIFDVSEYRVWDMWREVLVNQGIRPRGIHCLRHTFACRYLLRGGDSLDLKRILGHESLAMTDHYSSWIADRRAIESYHRLGLSPVDALFSKP